MSTVASTLLSLVLLAALLLSPTTARGDDGFYETRLASGKMAYVEKRMPDAVTDLRIAAFGFLDRPALLSETLVWLTLAESASGRPDRMRWALTRFIEVETRFHPYRQLAIDTASRGAFEKALVATLSPDTIASVPTLADLVRRPATPSKAATPTRPPAVAVIPTKTKGNAPKPAPAKPAPTPTDQTSAAKSPASPEKPLTPAPVPSSAPAQKSSTPATSPANPVSPPAQQTAAASPQPAPTPAAPANEGDSFTRPAPAVRPAEATAAETLTKARQLLEKNDNSAALTILKDLVARTPSRRARLLLLHAATRTHNWQTAVAQIPLIQPFTDGEEVTMFYASVSLYHAGRTAEARPLLERALPGIKTSPYVENYKLKIFGR